MSSEGDVVMSKTVLVEDGKRQIVLQETVGLRGVADHISLLVIRTWDSQVLAAVALTEEQAIDLVEKLLVVSDFNVANGNG